MRSPTADEMARITRRPGNSRVTDETIAAKKSVIEKILTAKGVSPELRVAVWEAGIREWSHTGTDPYEWCKGTVLADWQQMIEEYSHAKQVAGVMDVSLY